MLSLLHRYVLRELLRSFVLAFVTLASIMLLGALFKPLKMGLSLSYVGVLLPYLLPYTLAWVIPASLLTACVMAYGRLSAENELLAVCASGVPLRYMCYPAFLVAIVLTAFCLPLNDTIIPHCRVAMQDVVREAFYEDPFGGLPILGTFEIGEQKMYIERVDGNVLYNVIVVEPPVEEDDPKNPSPERASTQRLRVFRARRAHYEVDKEKLEIHIILEDAQYTIVDPNQHALGWHDVSAQEQNVVIKTEDPSSLQKRRRAERATRDLMVALETCRGDLAKAREDDDRTLVRRLKKRCSQLETEIRLREALAFSVLALALVGVPLGIWMRRESRLASFALAVAVFLLLYAMLIGGEGLAIERKVAPKVGLWAPCIFTGALGLVMLLRTFRR
jgi:lipopolysaccharide export system permease protein